MLWRMARPGPEEEDAFLLDDRLAVGGGTVRDRIGQLVAQRILCRTGCEENARQANRVESVGELDGERAVSRRAAAQMRADLERDELDRRGLVEPSLLREARAEEAGQHGDMLPRGWLARQLQTRDGRKGEKPERLEDLPVGHRGCAGPARNGEGLAQGPVRSNHLEVGRVGYGETVECFNVC